MSKKTRYTLTAAIGDQPAGTVIELTSEQAQSPLYASRISEPTEATTGTGPSYDELREQSLGELGADARKAAEQVLTDAKAEATKVVTDAQAEAMKLATGKK